jgi:hypothetical protein
MRTHRKIWLLVAIVLFVAAVWFGFYFKRAVGAPPVSARFMSYTNSGSVRFAFIDFVNRERVPIWWRTMYIEEAGKSEYRAPVSNTHFPWPSAMTLDSGASETLAIGCPDANVTWRVCWNYQPLGSTNIYTVKSGWFQP